MEGKMGRRSWVRPFATGIVAGALVGGTLAVLFVPKSGKETRKGLGDMAHRVRSRIGAHV